MGACLKAGDDEDKKGFMKEIKCSLIELWNFKWRTGRSISPAAVLSAILTLTLVVCYVVLLGFFATKAKDTLMVSLMKKADYCLVETLQAKHGESMTKCCNGWLGVVCRDWNFMPCMSVSVKYRLPEEPYVRHGYLNYWDPSSLLVEYASNSHCLVMPITCPNENFIHPFDRVVFTLDQKLNCYINHRTPDRPLYVAVPVFHSAWTAAALLIVPAIFIICSAAICHAFKVVICYEVH